MNSKLINLLLVAAVVVIFGLSFVIGGKYTSGDEAFGGADAQATEQIQELNPDYEPWFNSVFTPDSGELESGLFALQAGLGGGIFGYCIGVLRTRRVKKEAVIE